MMFNISEIIQLKEKSQYSNTIHYQYYRVIKDEDKKVVLYDIDNKTYKEMTYDEIKKTIVYIEDIQKWRIQSLTAINEDFDNKYKQGDIVYIFKNDHYIKCRYLCYDTIEKNHIVKTIGTFKYLLSCDNNSLMRAKKVIDQYVKDMDEITQKIGKYKSYHNQLKELDCYKNLYRNITKIIALQNELNSYNWYNPVPEEITKQTHCINKGIKRLKKRIYYVILNYKENDDYRMLKICSDNDNYFNAYIKSLENRIKNIEKEIKTLKEEI